MTRVYIAAYKGVSTVSVGIKLVTWGDFSHVALVLADGQTIEAWHLNHAGKTWLERRKGVVEYSLSPWTVHTTGTPVTIFDLKYPVEYHQAIWNSALTKVGCEYDYRALLGFWPGLRIFWKDNPKKWFCSHQVMDDCDIGPNMRLFNETVPAHKIDPSYLVSSPWLAPLGVATGMAEFTQITRQIKT